MFEKVNKLLEKYMIITFRVHTTVYVTSDGTGVERSELKLVF